MKSLRPILWLYTLPAILLALIPAVPAALLYDRTAILHGQLWRLWTGHWIHFSWSHLGWNLVVLLLAGARLERLHPGRLLRFTLLAAPAISAWLLICAPTMTSYGGLSGLAAGVVVLRALEQLRQQPDQRLVWGMVLGLVAAKFAVEAIHLHPLFSDLDPARVRTSTLAHVAGAGCAVVAFALSRKPTRRGALALAATSATSGAPS